MENFLSLTLSGAVSGAVYSLLAVGLVLSYTTSKTFNFGHAATAFATAVLYYQLHSGVHWSEPMALIFCIVIFAPAMGLLWDKLVFSRLADAEDSVRIVCSVGILIVMPALTLWVVDILRVDVGVHFLDISQAYQVPGVGPTPPTSWHLLNGLIINSDQVIVLGAGAIVFVGLWFVLNHSRLGLWMRTAVDGPVLAGLRGTNTGRVSSLAWVLSFTVAGLAGVLAAPFAGGFGLSTDNYTSALFVAASAVVIARLRSIPIAFLAGLVLGAARNWSEGYLNGSDLGAAGRWIHHVQGLQDSLPYWVLFGALLVLGRGRNRRVAGITSSSVPPPNYLENLPQWRRWAPWIGAAVALVIVGLGPINDIWRQILIAGMATAIILLSFTIVTGLGGMISLAQSTFAGLAALVVGYAASKGIPFLLALLIALIVTGMLGAIVALPALRLGGLQITLATLALALLGAGVVFQLQWLTNGTTGWILNRPSIGPFHFSSDRLFFGLVFVLMLFAAYVVRNLSRSATGRAIVAVRSAEYAARASCVSPQASLLTIFVVAAVLAGLGGVLLVEVSGSVVGTSFPPVVGFTWLAAVIIFGVNRPAGAMVAGLVTVIFPRLLSNGVHIGTVGWGGTGFGGSTATLVPQILFGMAAIGLAKHPYGILSQMAEGRYEKRRKKEARVEAQMSADVPESVRTASPAIGTRRDPVDDGGGVILELFGVSAGYGQLSVLKGVNLTVRAGSALVILGPNGAGKSTLCGVVAGLVTVTEGSVVMGGRDITHLAPYERTDEGIVLLPESRGIFPGVSVDDNLSLWLRDPEDREKVYERFPAIGARRRVPAGNLSGGEQQMLGLGPLLVRPPKLLVVDEPTLGLSPQIGARVMSELHELRERGTSILMAEEKAVNGLKLADQIGAMARGNLLWVADRSEVTAEDLHHAYLGVGREQGTGEDLPASGLLARAPGAQSK